jgi:hypothetical protein
MSTGFELPMVRTHAAMAGADDCCGAQAARS